VKLSVRHTFPVAPEVFWELFWDPGYDERMQRGSTVTRTLIADKTEGRIRTQRYRMVPQKTLPAPVAKVAGTDRFTYEQENRCDLDAGTIRWKVFPAVMGDKVTAEGTFTVRACAGGCERVVDGVIEVRVMFVGGTVEQQIVKDVQAGYELAAKAFVDFAREKGKL
jgi:hypothetical protein